MCFSKQHYGLLEHLKVELLYQSVDCGRPRIHADHDGNSE